MLRKHFPDSNIRTCLDFVRWRPALRLKPRVGRLNPGRYVGVKAGQAVSNEDFKEQVELLNEELEGLNLQARELEQQLRERGGDFGGMIMAGQELTLGDLCDQVDE